MKFYNIKDKKRNSLKPTRKKDYLQIHSNYSVSRLDIKRQQNYIFNLEMYTNIKYPLIMQAEQRDQHAETPSH